MSQVLVLNASYEPLNITSWRRAVVMMCKGKAESLEQDPRRLIHVGTHLPTVIRMRYYVRVPFRELPLTRQNVFHRDNHTCQYCGCNGGQLSIDHVIPRSRGGEHTWENITTACLKCNVKKGNQTPKESGMPLLRDPLRPISTFSFEVTRHIHGNVHRQWAKYLVSV